MMMMMMTHSIETTRHERTDTGMHGHTDGRHSKQTQCLYLSMVLQFIEKNKVIH